jgi:hypothetical protein
MGCIDIYFHNAGNVNNVYTTHDKLSAMTEATSELVIWRNARLATLNPDHAQVADQQRVALQQTVRLSVVGVQGGETGVSPDNEFGFPAGAGSISKAGWSRRD